MKSAGKARNNGLYRHIRTSKEIIRNLLNDYVNYKNRHCILRQKNTYCCRKAKHRITIFTQRAGYHPSQPAAFLSSRFFLCLCDAISELLAAVKSTRRRGQSRSEALFIYRIPSHTNPKRRKWCLK